jgi:hypothetical protein
MNVCISKYEYIIIYMYEYIAIFFLQSYTKSNIQWDGITVLRWYSKSLKKLL